MIPSMQGSENRGGFLGGGMANDDEDDDNDVGIPMDDDDDDDVDGGDDGEGGGGGGEEGDDEDDDGLDEILRRVEREDLDEEEEELRYYGYKPSKFRKLQRPGICEGRGRSIVHVLSDRARLGSQATAYWRAGWAWKEEEDDKDDEDEEDDLEESRGVQDEDFLETTTSRRRAVTGADEAHLEDSGEDRLLPLPERLKLNAPPLSIRDEMGYFAEYHSVIQCRSAYLDHLGGERNQGAMTPLPKGTPRNPKQRARHRQELLRQVNPPPKPPTSSGSAVSGDGVPFTRRPPPPPRQPPAPPSSTSSSAAVSTISVAFSPDGRTLASTHGDHTVKITCCQTGRLIRSLEGHPRTPWTVKYHPNKPNVVASGCLGYQVRIWDWNFKNHKDSQATNTTRRRARSAAHFFDRAGTRQPRRRPPFWVDEEMAQDDNRTARQRQRRPPHHSRRESPRGVVQYDYDNGSKSATRLMSGAAGTTASSTGGMDTWITTVREDAEQYDYQEGMGVCLHMIRLSFAIISLSFHPSGLILAIASGSTLHLWDYDDVGNKEKMAAAAAAASPSTDAMDDDSWRRQRRTAAASRPPAPPQNNRQGTSSTSNRGTVTEWRHDQPLRCVHFPPSGDTVIVGGANPPTGGGGGMSGGGMSFSLTLYNFDLDAALHPHLDFRDSQIPRDVITRPRTFVHRALLYNDGGFDVSPDGKTLCACAEYWLPDGVNNAMDLFVQGTDDDYLDEEEDVESLSHVVPPRRERDPLGLTADEPVVDVKNAEADVSNERGASDGETAPATASVETPVATNALGQRVSGARANNDDDHEDKELDEDDGFQSPPRDPLDLEVAASTLDPRTPPPDADQPRMSISPPPPPGRRWPGGLLRRTDTNTTRSSSASANSSGVATGGSAAAAVAARLQGGRSQPGRSTVSDTRRTYLHPTVLTSYLERERRSFEPVGRGRFVPHVVTVSLDTSAEPSPSRTSLEDELEGDEDVDGDDDSPSLPPCEPVYSGPQLGQVLEASPLDGPKASGVTCVKFSPSAEFCLLGYGVRETPATAPPPARRRQLGGRHDQQQRRQRRRKGGGRENSEGAEEDDEEEDDDDEEEDVDWQDEEDDESALYHPVTAIYRIRGGMTHISTMLSGEDDVNIARFHPDVGYGMVYGTKQGRVRVLGPRPWNYYHC